LPPRGAPGRGRTGSGGRGSASALPPPCSGALRQGLTEGASPAALGPADTPLPALEAGCAGALACDDPLSDSPAVRGLPTLILSFGIDGRLSGVAQSPPPVSAPPSPAVRASPARPPAGADAGRALRRSADTAAIAALIAASNVSKLAAAAARGSSARDRAPSGGVRPPRWLGAPAPPRAPPPLLGPPLLGVDAPVDAPPAGLPDEGLCSTWASWVFGE